MNMLLVDHTFGMILSWKDLVQMTHWSAQTSNKQPVSQERVSLDNYFKGLLEPAEHLMEQIEKSESPMSVQGLALTAQLRNRLLISALTSLGFAGKTLIEA